MKIGMFVNNLEVSGGYQKLVIRLSQQLMKAGHEVTIYTPKLDKEKCYPGDIKKLKVVTLPKNLSGLTPVETYGHLVKKVVSDLDALIIHDELSLLGVAQLPKPLPRKIVWMLNNQLPEALTKYSSEVSSVYQQTVGTLGIKKREVQKAIRRVKLFREGIKRTTDFAVYDELNKRLVNRILKRKAEIVYAGADLEQFKKYASSRTFTNKKSYTVLSVGVVFPHRRNEDLIEAMAILAKKRQDIKVIIVGRQDLSPDYFETLVKLTRKLKVEGYIEFKNYVSDEKMVQLYKQCDIFAFINDGFTWGISVFEAVAAKMPVIITNNIGAVDLITNKKTGWVVRPRDPVDVAKAVNNVLSDPQATRAIVEKAASEISPLVLWESYTNRMLAIINQE